MNSCNTDRFLATTVVYGLSTLNFLQERKIPKKHARQSKIIKDLHKVSHAGTDVRPVNPCILSFRFYSTSAKLVSYTTQE